MKMEAKTRVMHLQAKESRHQNLGEEPGIYFPIEPPQGTNPASILISDFWLPEPGDNTILLF